MTGGTDPLSVIKAAPEWHAVLLRLKDALITRSVVPADDPGQPVAGAPMTVIEEFARHLAYDSSPKMALQLTLPMTLVTTSIACQGAVVFHNVEPDGTDYESPLVLQAMAIAPSGYGKSTVLNPMVKMIDRVDWEGQQHRRELVAKWTKEIEQDPAADSALWKKVLDFAKCHHGLHFDQGNNEGMRSALLLGGGVAGVMTAEPDVLQEVNRYVKDGNGSLRWFVDGYGSGKITVSRAQSKMTIPRGSLPYFIMLQPQAFQEFTTSGRSQGKGDPAVDRGLYGRCFLTRAPYRDKAKFAYGMAPVKETAPGALSALEGLRLDLEEVLRSLCLRTSQYRAEMGRVIGWADAVSRREEPAGEPPLLPSLVRMTLGDDDARYAFAQVQNIRVEIEHAVSRRDAGAAPDDGEEDSIGGIARIMYPFVSRLTDHAVRLAMALTLAGDPAATGIPGWAMRDAGLRLLPWLAEHWAQEMWRYREDSLAALLTYETLSNPRGVSTDMESKIKEAIDSDFDPAASFSEGEVWRVIRKTVSSARREELRPEHERVFRQLVKTGQLSSTSGAGRLTKYARTPAWKP